MFKTPPAFWLVPIFFLSGMTAAEPAAPASPASASIAASYLAYRSVFDSYKPYTDDKLLNWKDANETTSQIGGRRVDAKEARQLDDKAPAHNMSHKPAVKPEVGKP